MRGCLQKLVGFGVVGAPGACSQEQDSPLCAELLLITQEAVNQSASDGAIMGGPGLRSPLSFPCQPILPGFQKHQRPPP